ncbi:hypothetical protein Pcinc_017616 [Petrolisthes cinctipes]|uniref:Uncharacterized protein n=1 Tax=Petrolisthes cinctipes TaxID=88211 RepID=A0AAE1FNW9_PETCI|nr:hypothetical protein Pcinc_017616 [Petrolisthes cinctipes]
MNNENDPSKTPFKGDEDVIVVTPPAREPIPIVHLNDSENESRNIDLVSSPKVPHTTDSDVQFIPSRKYLVESFDNPIESEKSPAPTVDPYSSVSPHSRLLPLIETTNNPNCEESDSAGSLLVLSIDAHVHNTDEPTKLPPQSKEHEARANDQTEIVMPVSSEPSLPLHLPTESLEPAERSPKAETDPEASTVSKTRMLPVKAVPYMLVTTASPVIEIFPPDNSVDITPPITIISSARPPITIISGTKCGEMSQNAPKGRDLVKNNIPVILESPLSPDSSDTEDMFQPPPSLHPTHLAANQSTSNCNDQGTPNSEGGNGVDKTDSLTAGESIEGPKHITSDKLVTEKRGITNTPPVPGETAEKGEEDMPKSVKDLQVTEKVSVNHLDPDTSDPRETSPNTGTPTPSTGVLEISLHNHQLTNTKRRRNSGSTSSSSNQVLSSVQDQVMSLQPDDEWDHTGKAVAAKLSKLPEKMQIYAEKLIYDVLYQAQRGFLNDKSKLCSVEHITSYPNPSYSDPSYSGQSYPGQSYSGQSRSYSGSSYPSPSYPGPSYPGPSYPGSSYPGPSYPGQSYPGQSYPGQSYPGQSYPGQAYPGHSYPGHSYPSQSYPSQSYPSQSYPSQSYPSQSYPSQSSPGTLCYDSSYCDSSFQYPTDYSGQMQAAYSGTNIGTQNTTSK